VATPAVVNVTSGTFASAAAATLTAPASLAAGDLLVAFLSTPGGTAHLGPNAYWLRGNSTVNNTHDSWWAHTVDGGEPASWAWSWTTASTGAWLVLHLSNVGRGLDALDVDISSNLASTNYLAPSISPYGATDLLVNVYRCSTANAITVPGGQSNAGGVTGNGNAIIAGYQTLAAAGATGTRTATGTSAASTCFSTVFKSPINAGRVMVPAMGYGSARDLLDRGGAAVAGRGPYRMAPGGGTPAATDRESMGRRPYSGGSGLAIASGYAGAYRIAGVCQQAGTLALLQRLVLLSPQGVPALVIAAVYSDPVTGAFAFNNIAPGRYIVEGVDTGGVQDVVVHALVTAVAM
jgi:hypothetical protein